MSDTAATATTNVSEVELNLDDILGTPGAESVMLPSTEPKPNLFTSKPVDTSFLNDPIETQVVTDEPKAPVVETDTKPKPTAAEISELIDLTTDDQDPESTKTTGRPKLDKSGLVELTNKLVEKGLIMPFDDDKPIDSYTLQDFEELLEVNINEREKKLKESVPGEFFDALPRELQYAAKYVADGGNDLKGLFHTLAASEEVKSLDPTKEEDQEKIVRLHLEATDFGTSDEIQDEIDGWKDRKELAAKANKFKPKLDAIQEQVVAKQLAAQETRRKQQEHQAQVYMTNVYNVLEPGELNGIKIDKKTQQELYSGLVQPNYPSISGRQTNKLGHLLEKYQFVEPNHALIAEALWLLSDPDGYKAKLKESGKKEITEKHVRMLKTEQANKSATVADSSESTETKSTKKASLPRPSQNFFKRS
jgi:hypothetical protein